MKSQKEGIKSTEKLLLEIETLQKAVSTQKDLLKKTRAQMKEKLSAAETEKKKLITQLNKAQRTQAIGTIAGGIAHDFNNILGAIIGYTELAMYDEKIHSVKKKNLSRILKAAERARNMVQKIIAFSSTAQELMEPLSIAKITESTIKFLRTSVPASIEIWSQLDSNDALVMANETQINQVIISLCINSVNSMEKNGGILDIRLRKVKIDREESDVTKLAPGCYQQLTISDTGKGMTNKTINDIFDPYFTSTNESENSTLGLSVAFGIVNRHGGTITVFSEPDKGSTFHVFLPEIKEKHKEKEVVVKTAAIPTGEEHILLVDDEYDLIDTGKQILEKLGYTVTGFTQSIDALEHFIKNPNKYDILITDMTMPQMQGVQLTKEIHKVKPGLPVILCTGFSEQINQENYRQQGFAGFVMKPMTKRDIALKIRQILDGS